MKLHWSAVSDNPAKPVPLSEECKQCVSWWLHDERWASGVPLQVPPPSSSWEEELHISILETKVVQLSLSTFLFRIMGESVT